MDIKWKNINDWSVVQLFKKVYYLNIVKVIAFILIMATVFLMIVILENTSKVINDFEVFACKDYTASKELLYKTDNNSYNLNRILNYKSEKYINSDEFIAKSDFYERYENQYLQEYSNEVIYEEFIKERKRQYIDEVLSRYRQDVTSIKKEPGLIYYIASADGTEHRNTDDISKEFFKSHKVSYIIENNEGIYSVPQQSDRMMNFNLENGSKIFIAYDDEYINEKSAAWEQEYNYSTTVIYSVIACSIVFILILIYLISAIGRTADNKEIKLFWLDKLPTEILFILLIPTASICYVILAFCISDVIGERVSLTLERYNLFVWMFNIGFTVFASIIMALFLSIVKKIKSHTFLKGSITYKIAIYIFKILKKNYYFFKKVCQSVKNLFFDKIWVRDRLTATWIMKSSIMFFVGTVLLGCMFAIDFLFFGFIGLVLIIVYIVSTAWDIRDCQKINAHIKEIKEGNLSYQSEIGEKSIFYNTSKELSSIADGMVKNVQTSLRAERLKVELITNVSHDLKTPLTSIISYVDLIEKEETLPEHIKDYVKILSQKSLRLKSMIQDLFDLSKASSGEIVCEIERLDYCKLLQQILADLDEAIASSGLVFRIDIPQEPIYIEADGKKMVRVFDNLILNTLKYSLDKSRVYISLITENKKATVSIKNISNYEMNFSSNDIVERFARGDQSRTSDGAGLGLSIAQSFIFACGGEFETVVDGDLFKVNVTFRVKE